jgi:hypothetical protein
LSIATGAKNDALLSAILNYFINYKHRQIQKCCL